MTLGGIREDFYEGDISWHSINPYSVYWQVKLNQFKFTTDSEEVVVFDREFDVIVDSGTSFFLMP